ncbi:hypothetical protein GO988_15455 [Hymenobacter sp. HMF4947]|uniref:Uncharacterized protein n=1 Tax=Hymenobacter ginkgonis TaxID=2682976 RepID=A0A7K1TH56_9BACT|nr:hypothetical protein [Hymenobacter ginkgonis]MVN77729.1 hypothetical protein [Hymenobacter ginkgonis]
MKRIDFPIKPHLLKYLQVHLKLQRLQDSPILVEDYLLSKTNRFGFALNQLLRKPAKSARHEGSSEECTAVLGVDLRNFNAAYYDLLRGKLTSYVVFQFNDFVDDNFKDTLYWWVREHRARGSTIKDAIRSFMVFYDLTEDDVAYETLRKAVQRNAGLGPSKKKAAKTGDFPMNLSQKTGGLSQKKGKVSQKTGVLSQKDTFLAVRQELMKLPLHLFETEFFHAAR